MNYFAHGYRFLDDPYFVAGTAVPDWLNVVNRRARVRSKHALPFVDDTDPRLAAVARGIVQHHRDDAWFHETRTFTELSLQFTVAVRDTLPPDDGFRPSFLGHILVEILLDATLIGERPEQLDEYYAAVDQCDDALIARAVGSMATQPVDLLEAFVPRFVSERFLWDYADDAKLLYRLNQVMRRVKLPALPEAFCALLPMARKELAARKDELLRRPS